MASRANTIQTENAPGTSELASTGLAARLARTLGASQAELVRLAAIALLLVAVAFDHYTLEVGGLHVKPEHVLLPLLLLWLVWRAFQARSLNSLKPFVWLAPFLVATLAASAFNSPAPLASLKYTLFVAVVASAAPVTYWLVDTPGRLRFAVRAIVCVGVVEAAMAFAGLAAWWFGSTFGTQQGLGGIRVPYGTLWEANFLGSYLAAACMLALPLLLADSSRHQKAVVAAVIGFLLVALGLSLARVSWLAAGAVGALVVITCWRLRLPGRRDPPAFGRGVRILGITLVVVLAFLFLVAPVLFPGTAGSMLARVNPSYFDLTRDPSVTSRLDMNVQALEGIAAHPVIGNGAGSFGLLHPASEGGTGWISNLEMHLLFDSGIIGSISVLGGLALLLWRAWRSLIFGQPDNKHRSETLGLLGAILVLLIAYQTTEGTWLAFTWVYVGLLARAGGRWTADVSRTNLSRSRVNSGAPRPFAR